MRVPGFLGGMRGWMELLLCSGQVVVLRRSPPGAGQQSQRAEGFPPSATEQKTTKSKHLDLLFPTYCCIKIQLVH